MDIIAHFLWAFAIFFRRKKERWGAGLFGVMPDVVSFGPHLVLSLIAGTFSFGKPNLAAIPSSVFFFYNLTHSLIVFLLVFFIAYFFRKRIYWPLLGWGLHILIDIPSHSKDFFPTPFLWPLSDLSINGVSWGNPIFMIVNYSGLAIVYGWFIILARRTRDYSGHKPKI